MAKWKHEIDLADLYAKYENDDIDGHEMLTCLHQAFKTFIDANPKMVDYIYFRNFEDAVDELAWTDYIEDADYLLDTIYDFADANRIWVKTF
jgi:hypothetical protein